MVFISIQLSPEEILQIQRWIALAETFETNQFRRANIFRLIGHFESSLPQRNITSATWRNVVDALLILEARHDPAAAESIHYRTQIEEALRTQSSVPRRA